MQQRGKLCIPCGSTQKLLDSLEWDGVVDSNNTNDRRAGNKTNACGYNGQIDVHACIQTLSTKDGSPSG
eukprot:scaffold229817_cov34-Prasinocladus_malaysianus.AAC.1